MKMTETEITGHSLPMWDRDNQKLALAAAPEHTHEEGGTHSCPAALELRVVPGEAEVGVTRRQRGQGPASIFSTLFSCQTVTAKFPLGHL